MHIILNGKIKTCDKPVCLETKAIKLLFIINTLKITANFYCWVFGTRHEVLKLPKIKLQLQNSAAVIESSIYKTPWGATSRCWKQRNVFYWDSSKLWVTRKKWHRVSQCSKQSDTMVARQALTAASPLFFSAHCWQTNTLYSRPDGLEAWKSKGYLFHTH